MKKPYVAVASLGGTITMVSEKGGKGAGVAPKLTAADLISSVPALAEVADVRTETLATLPGASLQYSDLGGAFEWARRATLEGAVGVVLVQGTDTLEESAYLLDLYWDREQPLVLTGAMRPPQTAGSDGPANLLAAVLTAAAPQSHGLGVLAVMNDQVHVASRVRKTRSSGVHAFTSPDFGPVGYVEEGRVVYGNRPERCPPLRGPMPAGTARVALVETYLGDDAALLGLAALEFDGIVLSGFGVGHLPAALAAAVDQAVTACPVVLASRAGAGTTFSRTYGFVGSERDVLARGAVPAGWMDSRKARILLSCLLEAGCGRMEIEAEFRLRGAASGGLAVDQVSLGSIRAVAEGK